MSFVNKKYLLSNKGLQGGNTKENRVVWRFLFGSLEYSRSHKPKTQYFKVIRLS